MGNGTFAGCLAQATAGLKPKDKTLRMHTSKTAIGDYPHGAGTGIRVGTVMIGRRTGRAKSGQRIARAVEHRHGGLTEDSGYNHKFDITGETIGCERSGKVVIKRTRVGSKGGHRWEARWWSCGPRDIRPVTLDHIIRGNVTAGHWVHVADNSRPGVEAASAQQHIRRVRSLRPIMPDVRVPRSAAIMRHHRGAVDEQTRAVVEGNGESGTSTPWS